MTYGKHIFITSFLLAAAALSVKAQSIGDLVAALSNMPDYAATVTYAVTLPQAEDDIIYTANISQPASVDSYLIEWSVDTPSGPTSGFTAWFDGHFYSFRNNRLRELHREWDEAAVTDGPNAPQNTAQFASLLPSRLAVQMAELETPRYDYTITSNGDQIRVNANRLNGDDTDAELQWTFDARTLQPLDFYGDYNPGAISSQQVHAVYHPSSLILNTLSENSLKERHEDAFTLYRQSQFGIESMRGQQVPAFSLPILGSAQRMTRRATEGFPAPTALVLLDSDATLAPQLIAAVRRAIDRLPSDANVIWACTGKNPDAVGELLGELRPGETALLGARPLVRDCGAASLPVVLIVESTGRIADLIIGLNNQLEIDVIQMLNKVQV